MIKFYYNLAPNPTKVALMLEETGLPYELVPVDTRKGEQHAAAFRAINPNGKVPAIVDVVGTGVGPYAGQCVHFRAYAPDKIPYAIDRYVFEAKRHFSILDAELAKGR